MEKQDIVDKYFPVLDHGFIALKDYMGGDSDVVQAARVSYGQGTKKSSDDNTLIRYLMRNRHSTPSEMVQFKFHISMPIHVHRQFIRHRMSSTNEYSARYSVVPEVTYENYNLNLQSSNNKQGRNEQVLDMEDEERAKRSIQKLKKDSFDIYDNLVKNGVAREIARMHLPLNTYTYFYWGIDLHNLLHFLKLRCDSHAQWEIRQFANTLAGFVKEVCPLSFSAWYDYSFQAVNFSRLDRKLLQYYNGEFDYEYQIIQETWGNHPQGFESEMAKADIDKAEKKLLEKALKIGMSKRELEEFKLKLEVPVEQDFALDFSLAKHADYFKPKEETN